MQPGTVDPHMLASFLRETVGIVPPHLRSWAAQILIAGLPYHARIAERDRALIAARDFLPAGLSVAEQARQIHAELAKASRSSRPAHPDLNTLAGCLAHALLARDRVPDVQQVRRILESCL